MEIEPDANKSWKALVTFDNAHERWWFGAESPFFSMERQRLYAYMGHSLPPWGLLGNYGNKEFPQTVSIPNSVVGHVAGNLAVRASFENSDDEAAREAVAKTTLGYLEKTAELRVGVNGFEEDLATS